MIKVNFKNRFFNVAATAVITAVIGVTTIVSCSKTEEASNNDKFEDFGKLTNEYIQEAGENQGNVNRRGKFWKILAADLKGALQGAEVGGQVGGYVGHPVEGAIIGAVVGGATSSIEAGLDGAEVKTPELTENASNPYDFVGKLHYQIINESLSNADYYLEYDEFSVTNFYNFGKNVLIANNIALNNDFASFTIQDNTNVLNFVKSKEDVSNASFILNHTSLYFTPSVRLVLSQYFNALDASNDIDKFVAYSIKAENTIQKSLLLLPMEKQIILGTMSTARYGLQYWGR